MLRYLISFPGQIRPDQAEHYRRMLSEMADSRQWRDIVIADGGSITDLRTNRKPIPAVVRRARARFG